MPNFYVTYGLGSNMGRKFSVVEADDYPQARQKIADAIGSKFAFCYDEEEFEGQAEEFGLTEARLQPQSFSREGLVARECAISRGIDSAAEMRKDGR